MGCKGGCGKTGWKPQKTKDLQPIQTQEIPVCQNCDIVDRWFVANTYPAYQEFLSAEFFTLFEDTYFPCWIVFQKNYSGCENERCGLLIQAFDVCWQLIDGFYMRRKDIPFRISDVPSELAPTCENDLLVEWFDDVGGWLSIRINCVPIEQGNCFPTIDKSQCQMGCAFPVTGCCCDCMATCDDLVREVHNLNSIMLCLLAKYDCLIDIIGQSQLSVDTQARIAQTNQLAMIRTSENISQAIIAAGQAISKTKIPDYQSVDINVTNPNDITPLACADPFPNPCPPVIVPPGG